MAARVQSAVFNPYRVPSAYLTQLRPFSAPSKGRHSRKYSLIIQSLFSGIAPEVLRMRLKQAANVHNITLESFLEKHQVAIISAFSHLKGLLSMIFPPNEETIDLERWSLQLLCIVLRASECLTLQELDDVTFLEKCFRRHFRMRPQSTSQLGSANLKPRREWIGVCSAIQRLVENVEDPVLIKSVRNFICKAEMRPRTEYAERGTNHRLHQALSELIAGIAESKHKSDSRNGKIVKRQIAEIQKLRQNYADISSRPSTGSWTIGSSYGSQRPRIVSASSFKSPYNGCMTRTRDRKRQVEIMAWNNGVLANNEKRTKSKAKRLLPALENVDVVRHWRNAGKSSSDRVFLAATTRPNTAPELQRQATPIRTVSRKLRPLSSRSFHGTGEKDGKPRTSKEGVIPKTKPKCRQKTQSGESKENEQYVEKKNDHDTNTVQTFKNKVSDIKSKENGKDVMRSVDKIIGSSEVKRQSDENRRISEASGLSKQSPQSPTSVKNRAETERDQNESRPSAKNSYLKQFPSAAKSGKVHTLNRNDVKINSKFSRQVKYLSRKAGDKGPTKGLTQENLKKLDAMPGTKGAETNDAKYVTRQAAMKEVMENNMRSNTFAKDQIKSAKSETLNQSGLQPNLRSRIEQGTRGNKNTVARKRVWSANIKDGPKTTKQLGPVNAKNSPKPTPRVGSAKAKDVSRASLHVGSAKAKDAPKTTHRAGSASAKDSPKSTQRVGLVRTKDAPKTTPRVWSANAKDSPKTTRRVGSANVKDVTKTTPRVGSAKAKDVTKTTPRVGLEKAKDVTKTTPRVGSAKAKDVTKTIPRVGSAKAKDVTKSIQREGSANARDVTKTTQRVGSAKAKLIFKTTQREGSAKAKDSSKTTQREGSAKATDSSKTTPREGSAKAKDGSKTTPRVGSAKANNVPETKQQGEGILSEGANELPRSSGSPLQTLLHAKTSVKSISKQQRKDPDSEMKKMAMEVLVHQNVHSVVNHTLLRHKDTIDQFFDFLYKHQILKQFLRSPNAAPFKNWTTVSGKPEYFYFLHCFIFRHVEPSRDKEALYVVEKVLTRLQCQHLRTPRSTVVAASLFQGRKSLLQEALEYSRSNTMPVLHSKKPQSGGNTSRPSPSRSFTPEPSTSKTKSEESGKNLASGKADPTKSSSCWKCRQKDLAMTISINWGNKSICQLLRKEGVRYKMDHLLPAVKVNSLETLQDIVSYLRERQEWAPEDDRAKAALCEARKQRLKLLAEFLQQEGVQDDRLAVQNVCVTCLF